jgi:hypothetical protein
VRRHGDQAQSGAQTDAVSSHLVHAVFHRGKCDNPPRKIPYYRLRPITLVIKQ